MSYRAKACSCAAILWMGLGGCDDAGSSVQTPADTRPATAPEAPSPAKNTADNPPTEAPSVEASTKPANTEAPTPPTKPDDTASQTPPSKGITNANLAALLPMELRGAKRKLMNAGAFGGRTPEGFAAASYLLEDERRFININLQKVKDLSNDRAQFLVKADGERKEGNGRSLLGKVIDGRLAQRRYSHRMGESEVIMLIDDQISLMLTVEKAKSPDEALELLELLDIEAIAAIIP